MIFSTAKDTTFFHKGHKTARPTFALSAYFLFALFAIILFNGCAQILIPNGGEKDVTPPKVVKYIPDSAATNFKGKEISIAFNEYIQLKDVSGQLIISPPVEQQPEIKLIKNKILSITFKKPLKENTTYTMNFGASIADYNEGNVLDNFQYVFSTGSFIDSLSLTGKVQYAFDHHTEKGILVMLYEDLGDSAPFKNLPSYFTKTKPDGSYRINNIRAGKYKLFALKDENQNYRYDAAIPEVIGFKDMPIEILRNSSADMEVFREEPAKLKLKSKGVLGYGHILLVFNKPTEHLTVKALNVTKVPTEIQELSKHRDSLDYWFEGVTVDSLKLQLLENNVPFDTVNARLITKDMASKLSKGDKMKLTISSNVIKDVAFDLNKDILLHFSSPVISTDHLEFKTLVDSQKVKKNNVEWPKYTYHILNYSQQEFRSGRLNAGLTDINLIRNPNSGKTDTVIARLGKWQEGHKYTYLIKPGFFTDIFGNKSDSVKLEFKTQELKYYGTLKLKFKAPASGYVLQLLDAKENILKEEYLTGDKDFFYDYLVPGAYKLKLIIESDHSNSWTAGNYLTKKQPEKVIYYSQPITVRSNWDMEVEWKITE